MTKTILTVFSETWCICSPIFVCFRGRNRARPYKYNSQLCFFTQRWSN